MPDRAARRSLWPREHGAYAQLLVPLITALALRPPTWSTVLLAAAACSAFLANEPLLVVLGHRGLRVRNALGEQARRRLAIAGSLAGLAGVAGLAIAPRAAMISGALASGLALMVVGMAWRRREHSIAGELVAAIALPGASAPILAAGGVTFATAMSVWAAWAIGFACTVVAVHRVIARHRRKAIRLDRVVAIGFAALVLGSVALAMVTPAAAIAAPLVLAATLLVVRPPPAKRLRSIGVALVVASLVAAALTFLTVT